MCSGLQAASLEPKGPVQPADHRGQTSNAFQFGMQAPGQGSFRSASLRVFIKFIIYRASSLSSYLVIVPMDFVGRFPFGVNRSIEQSLVYEKI